MLIRVFLIATAGALIGLFVTNCSPDEPNELAKLGTVDVTIKGAAFSLWIADDADERERGLMFVTREQMAAPNDGARLGMIFAFTYEQQLNFWMKNTIIPLDIAYLDSDGVVVGMHTMIPLDARFGQYPSGSPARFAVEVNAYVFSDLGLAVGDRIEIPPSVLKNAR